jgi:bifunctional DNA-binding transcriptional regulator/antitoxin component of YhaV-PrlF toxin-antitoxin module
MPDFEEIRTVTADGRLVIPWAVQRALGLEYGGSVRFQVENGIVTLAAASPPNPKAAAAETEPRGRSALMAELRTLMDAAERDSAVEFSRQ